LKSLGHYLFGTQIFLPSLLTYTMSPESVAFKVFTCLVENNIRDYDSVVQVSRHYVMTELSDDAERDEAVSMIYERITKFNLLQMSPNTVRKRSQSCPSVLAPFSGAPYLEECVEEEFSEEADRSRLEQEVSEEESMVEQEVSEEESRVEQEVSEEESRVEQEVSEEDSRVEQEVSEEDSRVEQEVSEEFEKEYSERSDESSSNQSPNRRLTPKHYRKQRDMIAAQATKLSYKNLKYNNGLLGRFDESLLEEWKSNDRDYNRVVFESTKFAKEKKDLYVLIMNGKIKGYYSSIEQTKKSKQIESKSFPFTAFIGRIGGDGTDYNMPKKPQNQEEERKGWMDWVLEVLGCKRTKMKRN
jgi:hypothetical protein